MVTAGLPKRMPLGFKRRIGIERNGIFVGGDVGPVERGFGFLSPHSLGEHVHQHQVRIGAAGDDAAAGFGQSRRQSGRVGQHLLLIRDELRRHRLPEAHRLGRDNVHQRTALRSRKHARSMAAAYFSFARIIPLRGPRRVLCVVEVTMSA